MAHNLDFSTGRAAIAYAGDTPWHGHGTPAQAGWTLADWIREAHIDYTVERVQAFANTLAESSGDGVSPAVTPVHGAFFNRRSDTGAILGTQTHTDRRVEVQPAEIAKFVHDYVATDDRFTMQVMGAIKGGGQIWATAGFNGEFDVAGQKHRAYLLARTGFDGSLATHFQLTTVRAVCNNTLSAAFADKRATFSLRHTAKFDAGEAGKRLAAMAASVGTYKAVGDALAQNQMAKDEVSKFFMTMLDIPAGSSEADISTRKMNSFRELCGAYTTSVAEGAPDNSAWTALQAVTRYCDHDRSARSTDKAMSEDQKRFESSQFGSGEAFKGKAMGLLMPRIRDRVLVAA